MGVMQLRGKRYVGTLQLGRLGRRAGRRFGKTHVARHSRILRLRAYVKGTGRSNIVRVRIGK